MLDVFFVIVFSFFFFKQKTAYDMRISDWSSDVCSSDLFHLADFTLPSDVPVTLPSELVHKRPDILQAEAELHAATAAIGVATARLYPDITQIGRASCRERVCQYV